MDESILYLDKRNNKKSELAERFSFIIAGLTLLISAYDGFMNPLPVRSFVDIFYLAISCAAGIMNIIFAVFINRITLESRKIFLYRLLLAISGLILITDGIDKIIQHKRSIQYALMFAGFLYLLVAVFYEKFRMRKFIRFNDEGIFYQNAFFKNRNFPWQDIKNIQLTGDKLLLIYNEKEKYKIKLASKEEDILIKFTKNFSDAARRKNIKIL